MSGGSHEDSTSSKRGQWDFRRETVSILQTRLKDAFREAGMGELFDTNPAEKCQSFCDDDNFIVNLATEVLQSLMLEKCPEQNDEELDSVMKAGLQTFLTTVLETNQQLRESAITMMKESIQVFASKYERKLSKFWKITSQFITEESVLQAFHIETSLDILNVFDLTNKSGSPKVHKEYRDQLQESIDKTYSVVFDNCKKLLSEQNKNKTEIIQILANKHLENLQAHAKETDSEEKLLTFHKQLEKSTIEKLQENPMNLNATQITSATMELKDKLTQNFRQFFDDMLEHKNIFYKMCEVEYDSCIRLYIIGLEKVFDNIQQENNFVQVQNPNELRNTLLAEFNAKCTENQKYVLEAAIAADFSQRLGKILDGEQQLKINELHKTAMQKIENKNKLDSTKVITFIQFIATILGIPKYYSDKAKEAFREYSAIKVALLFVKVLGIFSFLVYFLCFLFLGRVLLILWKLIVFAPTYCFERGRYRYFQLANYFADNLEIKLKQFPARSIVGCLLAALLFPRVFFPFFLLCSLLAISSICHGRNNVSTTR